MKTALDILNEKNRAIITVSSEATVADAIRTMAEHQIGAVVVKQEGSFCGIYTERDFLRNSLEEGFDPKTARIRDFMTCDLISAAWDDPVYRLMDRMLGKRIRHLLVEKEGRHIGLLSIGDVIRAGLNETREQLKSVSWDYYEDWKWKKK
ncbi:MAG TPA: CBS domain-containing protein [bacterium]|nr:CBS domain-containing protein [bacterium]